MSITGLIAVGNGEKCPFCDITMNEETDTLKHMMDKHPKELEKALFDAES